MADQHTAAVLTAVRTVEHRSVPIPSPGPDEILVRVLASGVCGSDLSTYRGTHPYKTAPVVLGHELCGTVVETGEHVSRFQRADLVCSAAYSPCEACDACLHGDPHLCSDRRNLSHLGWDGSFAQHVVLHANMAFRLADHVHPEAGAMAEPLSIALHAVRLGLSEKRDKGLGDVAVLGAGGIGLCCALSARRLGARRIACVDLGPAKAPLAAAAGADVYLDASAAGAAGALRSAWPAGADVTVVASGHPGALDDACALTRKGGRIVVVSYFDRPQSVSVNPFVAAEQAIAFSHLSTPRDFAEVTGWLADGSVDPRPLITHRFTLPRTGEALRLLDAPQGTVGKIMIHAREGLS